MVGLSGVLVAGCGGQHPAPDAAGSTAATPSAAGSPAAAGSASAPAGSAGAGGATASSGPATGLPASPGTAPNRSTGGSTGRSTGRATAPNTSQLRRDASTAQRRFVTRNAPPGVDAEAILQAGEDACHRMALAQHAAGTTAVAVALASGEIANGREAITYLCPQLTPALDAARDGFPDGSYRVGPRRTTGQVTPGRYHAPQAADQCTWSLTNPDGTVAAEGTGTTATARLSTGQTFTSTGCYAWLRTR